MTAPLEVELNGVLPSYIYMNGLFVGATIGRPISKQYLLIIIYYLLLVETLQAQSASSPRSGARCVLPSYIYMNGLFVGATIGRPISKQYLLIITYYLLLIEPPQALCASSPRSGAKWCSP